jgi:hypothetical protein
MQSAGDCFDSAFLDEHQRNDQVFLVSEVAFEPCVHQLACLHVAVRGMPLSVGVRARIIPNRRDKFVDGLYDVHDALVQMLMVPGEHVESRAESRFRIAEGRKVMEVLDLVKPVQLRKKSLEPVPKSTALMRCSR